MRQEVKLELGKLCLGEGILYWSYGPNNWYRGTLVVELTKSGKQFGNFVFFLLIVAAYLDVSFDDKIQRTAATFSFLKYGLMSPESFFFDNFVQFVVDGGAEYFENFHFFDIFSKLLFCQINVHLFR